uniref:Peroxin-19 n=1 Tax=Caenorhabditis tropicalis TaxID=1561998 RepID=A0A1I7UUX8_9PELO
MSSEDKNSVESLRNKTDEELSQLLEETLAEFSNPPPPPPRTTDDELDALMANADQEAAQKAAKDFQRMLEQMVNLQEEAIKKAEVVAASGENPDVDPNDPEALAMMDALKQLMECSSNVANASSSEEFMAGLDMLRSPNSPMEPFMNMIMQTLASKEVMYPPLKEIYDNYPKYLEENGDTLDKETKERYEAQYEILGKICAEFEKEPNPVEVAVEATATSAPPKSLDELDAEEERKQIQHFEVLGKLLVDLQKYGYPPKELVGALPEGWQLDEGGLPKVTDPAAAQDACSIM